MSTSNPFNLRTTPAVDLSKALEAHRRSFIRKIEPRLNTTLSAICLLKKPKNRTAENVSELIAQLRPLLEIFNEESSAADEYRALPILTVEEQMEARNVQDQIVVLEFELRIGNLSDTEFPDLLAAQVVQLLGTLRTAFRHIRTW